MSNTSSLLGVLILLNVILVGCRKDNVSTAKDETSVGIGCSTTSNGTDNLPNITGYPIVGANQTKFFNNSTEISAPSVGSAFYGQNAMYLGNVPHYVDNGDGTVTDMVTGLMWQQSPDNNCDDIINAKDKVSYAAAVAGASGYRLGGHSDWRLPTIKELYSLIEFCGLDPNVQATSSSDLTPFIDTTYFKFGYGDVAAGDRIIDGNFVSSTKSVSKTCGEAVEAVFGVNFADGRIKGYPIIFPGKLTTNVFYFRYVRGNTNYGINGYTDNGNGTISDKATGLMWMQNDNAQAISWENALSYAENFEFAGYSDWRLPDAKELQSIVDYTRSPKATNSPAINPVFNCTKITNEAGNEDYPCFWSSTTHASMMGGGGAAVYICFGRGMGYMPEFGGWSDVHGAGCQRSDPKTGNASDFPHGHGPQGDAIRILNYVRLVRTIK
ncbi:MAG: DUF1566 domain-containing protein [Bacteroidetes bacterium]|nr:DUF1566 domain-containing protein [Bacteroidota bacterium]